VADALTDRQRAVLEMFIDASGAGKPAPTYREICDEFEFTSTNAASAHVKALIKKGWLESSGKGKSRGIMLTDHARRLYGLPRRAA
jgi:repressor LexA